MKEETKNILITILAKLHTMPIKEHLCRFNDGEQDCECYTEALRDCRHLIKNYLLTPTSFPKATSTL